MKSMSSPLALILGAGSALLFCCFAGCSSSSTTPSNPGTGDDGGATQDTGSSNHDATPPQNDSGNNGDTAIPEVDAGTTYLRLMNLSPDAPALDFCISESAQTTYKGPMLRQLSGGTDAAAYGIAYGQSSGYIAFPSNAYDVMLVAAGATDCTLSVGPFSASTSTLDDGVFATLAAIGDVTPTGSDQSLGMHTLLDDSSASGNGVVLRFVNATPSVPAVDFGTGSLSGANFAGLFVNVPFAAPGMTAAADAGTEDSDYYLPLATPNGQTMSAHATAATGDAGIAADLVTGKVTLTADKPGTVFLIGGKTGDASHPIQLLACEDGAAMYPTAPKCTIAAP